MANVTVYSTEGCQYCRLTRGYLSRLGVPFTEVDVGRDKTAAEEMVNLSGQYGVPVTVVDGEVIVGFDVKRFRELFETGGALDVYDMIIIGGGPAGLTAATYASRKMLSVLVLTENIGGQALESWAIENYMGFRLVTGGELMQKFEEKMREEAGITLELDSVTAVREEDEGRFVAETASARRFSGRSVIITSGLRPRWLGLPEENRFIGRGVSICSTCDGPLFAEKTVAVVGGGNYALTTAIEMGGIATEVHLIVRSDLRADEIYRKEYRSIKNIITHKPALVTAIHGETLVQGITITDQETGKETRLAVDGIFLAIGHQPNNGFLDGFVETNDHGEVMIDVNCTTSRPGVFAAGDITEIHGKQVIIAAGEGAKAALEAYQYLSGKH
ncbi:FAD-dependent oxidoreductase [Methanogenium sp. MK-MG]|uniref:FAD-dependent oxidoreductase n=1 Tax=Methanogenium sp. MK-MG TaxID=2599926 RepID=UPI0013EBB0BC|nr:FAD-dependent oxidoreductase [Methanogenium sp. MK-MG]KAF1078739.1 Ferredoxin--NADP reductase [Methanogenium sp. MK-MG]